MAVAGATKEVTDLSFETDVLKSTSPVVVDFWAVWCGPCRIIAPVVEELAGEYKDRVAFVKLDVDNNPQTAMKYGVRSIPTLLFFKDGKPVDQVVGAIPKRMLKQRVDAVLAAKG